MARPKMSVLFMPSEDMCRATAAYSSFPLLFTCQVHREKNAGIEANRNFLSLVATINEITHRHTHTLRRADSNIFLETSQKMKKKEEKREKSKTKTKKRGP